MTWFKVDDGLAFHPKTVQAGNAAMGMWVRAGAWSSANLTDGFVPDAIVSAFARTEAERSACVRELCAVGLWNEAPGGYQMHDYTEYNPTRKTVLSERAKARKRMRDLRERSPEQDTNNDGTSPEVQRPRTRSSYGTNRGAPRGSSVPPDLTLTDAMRAYAATKNVDADTEFESFINHHTAKGSTFKDWNAAWRTWVGKAVQFGRTIKADERDPWAHVPLIRGGQVVNQ